MLTNREKATALWIELLLDNRVAHGALLVQLCLDLGVAWDMEVVRQDFLVWEARGWITRGERRPVPFQKDLGNLHPDGPWNYDWAAPPLNSVANLDVRAFLGHKDVWAFLAASKNTPKSGQFTVLAALVHFDRTAGDVLRQMNKASPEDRDAAMVDYLSKRYQEDQAQGRGGRKGGGK